MTTHARQQRAGDLPLVSASGLVLVDKSPGMTSHDVVARIRRLADTRRVGHAGTLDPMATGVLVIGIEKATRLLGHLALTEKDYSATIRLGQATVTDDAEGVVLATAPHARQASAITESELLAGLRALTGEIRQVPPKVSAIKVNGQRAYHLTRSGAAPELKARTVTVWRLEPVAVRPAGELLDVDVLVTCSSGTYIRAIARDLGAALGTGGHLTALRRTRVGPYQVAEARTLGQLSERFEFVPLASAAAAAFPSMRLSAEQARLVSHGVRLRLPELVAGTAASSASGSAEPGLAEPDPAGPDPAGPGLAEPEVAAAGEADVPGQPIAAFGPDGELVALMAERDAELRPLAVFAP